MQTGDWVKLVRKITGEVLVVTLTELLTHSNKPVVEVEWKAERGIGVERYRLDLEKNVVSAVDGSQRYKASIRAWWLIDEDDRKQLLDTYWAARKNRRK